MRVLQELALDGQPVHRIGGRDLCQLLDVTPAMLSELKRRGIARHLGHDAWDLQITVTAYVQHLRGVASGRGTEEATLTLTGERARLARAQAEAVEMKNAQARGELVAAEDVTRAWSDILRTVRSRVLAVPSRLRQSLALDTGTAEGIDRELRAALAELGGDGGQD
jgi:phage terminase Nu1 subunit (DNA packaging protein)